MFGCEAEETSETMQQILCCDSSAALGMIKRKGSTRKTRHIELKAFFLQQRATRSETCPSDTKFGASLETRIGGQIQRCTDLNLVATIQRRGAEYPLVFQQFLVLRFSLLLMAASHVPQ